MGATAVVTGIAGLSENLLGLAEMQARLAVIELRQNVEAAKRGAGILLCGSFLAVASLAVGLLGIAEVCVSEFAVKRSFALLTVAGASLAITGAAAATAVARAARNSAGFPL